MVKDVGMACIAHFQPHFLTLSGSAIPTSKHLQIVNARRACAQGIIVLALCVCVSVEFSDFISSLYDKMNLPA